jgi:iron complex outermembrane receptor protein
MAQGDLAAPDVIVSVNRFRESYLDKPVNATIIPRAAIVNTTAKTLPDLLSQQAGIGTRDLYGNNAAGATVDLRGFGANATQNTLILLDGRRLGDADLSGVQWSAVPLEQIERVEIVRGGGAVQYGDGATAGVINIITRRPEAGDANAFIGARAGSYDTYEVQAGASKFFESVGVRVFASDLNSQGFRDNNQNAQTSGQAEFRWLREGGEVRLTAGADRQRIRLPGARLVVLGTPVNEVETDPRGTSTPLDYATRDGNFAAVDWNQRISFGEAALGVSYRDKGQTSYFDFNGFPDYRDVSLKLLGVTPRMKFDRPVYGHENLLVVGVDLYNWDYRLEVSDSPSNIGTPINRVDGTQRNAGVYVQDTFVLTEATTLSVGYRRERFEIDLSDTFDPNAPGAFFGQSSTGSQRANVEAWDLGVRHRVNGPWSVIARAGRSFRFANVDEIYETSPSFLREFQFLRPQTSKSFEISGEYRRTRVLAMATLFQLDTNDEIRLDPYTLGRGNTNLPPIRRRGVELSSTWEVAAGLTLNGAYTFTDATFLEGVLPGGGFSIASNVALAGNTVPLVPRNRLSLGLSWAISPATRLNVTQTAVSDQFMENDETNNLGARIPAYALTDVQITHNRGAWRLTVAVNNLFDRAYYNYAVRSQFNPNRFNAYPLPGRTASVALTYTFQ